jgi:hypothetical protein
MFQAVAELHEFVVCPLPFLKTILATVSNRSLASPSQLASACSTARSKVAPACSSASAKPASPAAAWRDHLAPGSFRPDGAPGHIPAVSASA